MSRGTPLAFRTLIGAAAFLVAWGTVSPARALGSCHAYFPLAEGTTWEYEAADPRRKGGKLVRRIRVTRRTETRSGVRATLAQTVGAPGDGPTQGQGTLHADCDGEGLRLRVEGEIATDGGTRAVRAVLPGLPPAERLRAGHVWRSATQVETGGAGPRARTQGRRGSRVVGTESVTVPACRFKDAVKIVSVEKLTVASPHGPAEARQETTDWYATGVGLILREIRISIGEAPPVVSREALRLFQPAS